MGQGMATAGGKKAGNRAEAAARAGGTANGFPRVLFHSGDSGAAMATSGLPAPSMPSIGLVEFELFAVDSKFILMQKFSCEWEAWRGPFSAERESPGGSAPPGNLLTSLFPAFSRWNVFALRPSRACPVKSYVFHRAGKRLKKGLCGGSPLRTTPAGTGERRLRGVAPMGKGASEMHAEGVRRADSGVEDPHGGAVVGGRRSDAGDGKMG
jgi:hypothetical protein